MHTEVPTARPKRSVVPLLAAALGVMLAYLGTLWLVVLHVAEGAHEQNEPPLVLHWLRDASLAIPLVVSAVVVTTMVLSRMLTKRGIAAGRTSRRVLAVGAGASAAFALAAGAPIHGHLFGAHEDMPLLVHSGYEFLMALGVCVPVALAAVAAGRAITSVPAGLVRSARRVAMPLVASLGLAISSLAIPSGAASAAVLPGASPCPAGVPTRSIDIRAIDVNIPLNKFGDHDPQGRMYVLNSRISDVRNQEATQEVSIGLAEDPIQPLVIRANEGECVTIHYENQASGGDYGLHIDGLVYGAGDSGDAIGRNPSSEGGSQDYTYWIPVDRALEGAHYMHPGPGYRDAVDHGLFGVLSVEPPGSEYLSVITGQPIESNWQATVVPASQPSFREPVIIMHEVGNEDYDIPTGTPGEFLPKVDPLTDAYRPGSRALNYRSEPFYDRLQLGDEFESLAYSAYTFADAATPSPHGYLGDPTKIRLVHGGAELFHVFHLHGGGDRWRFDPAADPGFDYADTRLLKKPEIQQSASTRLDSQSVGPGEAYDLEIEGGAGGVQKAAGDFLFHCHIAHHYFAGMWSFWRVFDTLQPDLAPLPDRVPRYEGVNSAGLIGLTMPNGVTITKDNLDDWIRPQLPPPGVVSGIEDATVWDWTVDNSDPNNPIYLREPDTTKQWTDLVEGISGHPGSYMGDEYHGGNRSEIKFDPWNGRPAWPLMRPHPGQRPPFSPNGHSGAPWLGEDVMSPMNGPVAPWAGREDGLCPQGGKLRTYNVVVIQRPIQVTAAGATDPDGALFVLAHDKQAVLNGTKLAQPLAIRANVGDCVAITLTSEETDASMFNGFAKANMHIHHVQFDPQASDGVITGMSYEQSVRPYKVEDPKLKAATAAGATTLRLSSVSKFQPGVWIGVGLGTEKIEIRQIVSIDALAKTVSLNKPLALSHGKSQWAGVEFVQYRWYGDVLLDNIFWHDHTDGIHGWAHGLVGQFIVEPPGSTYHDPVTGKQVDSGTIVDIHTNSPLAPGAVSGSFREVVLWAIDENPVAEATWNLRAEPWADRLDPLAPGGGDPSLLFSSYTHGDPYTPMPRAYPGDPIVIRTIDVGPDMDALHVDGHRMWLENRYLNPATGLQQATPTDTLRYGVSERFTMILRGGAGGPNAEPGDYLYMNGINRRFRAGAWGIIRVLPGLTGDLKPLPSRPAPPAQAIPTPTGGRPPAADAGNPCPSGSPVHSFDVSAVDVSSAPHGQKTVYALTSAAAAIARGDRQPEPLTLHVSAGQCLEVTFRNQRALGRASFHLGMLERAIGSSGVNVGYNPEQTVAPGGSRLYRFFADSDRIGGGLISDYGDITTTGVEGMYGAVIVSPAGSTFTHPLSGLPTDVGTQVDVHVPGQPSYRDFSVFMSDNDPRIGQNTMPYPTAVDKPALINYLSEPRPDQPGQFSSLLHGDPATPLLRAYANDPVRVHVWVAPGSEQAHVFSLGGMSFPTDGLLNNSTFLQARGLVPWEGEHLFVAGGAGGFGGTVGDFFYGDLRRPFTEAGMWGLFRVLSDPSCPIRPLDARGCG
jgi:hypothetical protein